MTSEEIGVFGYLRRFFWYQRLPLVSQWSAALPAWHKRLWILTQSLGTHKPSHS